MIRNQCNNHKTEHKDIIGNIETLNEKIIKGWFFNYKEKKVLNKENIKFLIDEKDSTLNYGIEREDVSNFYNYNEIKDCGFIGNIIENYNKLEIQYYDNDIGEWKNIYVFKKPELKINKNIPQLIVVDNFYENPDEVRNFALKQEFVPSGGHKGKRTTQDFNNESIKKRFEELIGKPVTKWDYKWNGCFQYCIAGDPLVVHCDVQNYAALVYLHKDAPCSTGTSFFRHKKLLTQYYKNSVFDKGNYDFTPFELVDKIGNIYNRLVIFDAKMIHAASEYFGKEPSDSRLFQIFFFDI